MADPRINSTRNWQFSEYAPNGEPIPDAVIPITSLADGSVLIAGLGDSITAQNTNGNAKTHRAAGFLNWACVYSRDRLVFDNGLNFGYSGQVSSYILAQLPAAIQKMKARNVKFCTVHMGTNDVSDPSIPPSDISNNTMEAARQLIAAQITPIVIPILPRRYGTPSVPVITAATQDRIQRANMLTRVAVRATPGIILVDATAAWTDHSNDLGYPLGTAGVLGHTADDLHPATRGAQKLGYLVFKGVEPKIEVASTSSLTGANRWSADNPTGNHLINGMMNGTGGAVGTRGSGQLADSWTGNASSGTNGTVTFSKTTMEVDGIQVPAQQAVFASVTGAATEGFLISQTGGNVAIGEKVYCRCEVEVSNIGADSLKSLVLTLRDGAAGNLVSCLTQDQYLGNDGWRGVLRTPVMTAEIANTALVRMETTIDGTKASAGYTLKFTKMEVITVEA